jgi:hypothetical protein
LLTSIGHQSVRVLGPSSEVEHRLLFRLAPSFRPEWRGTRGTLSEFLAEQIPARKTEIKDRWSSSLFSRDYFSFILGFYNYRIQYFWNLSPAEKGSLFTDPNKSTLDTGLDHVTTRNSQALVRIPNLPPYLPLASRLKPLQLSNFQRQAVFLLATPPVYRMNNHKMKTEEQNGRHELWRLRGLSQ